MEQELFFNFLCRKQLLGQVNRVYCQLAAAICRVLRSSSVWGQIRRNSGGIRGPPKASTITPVSKAEKVAQESFQQFGHLTFENIGLRHWRSIWLLASFKWFSVFFLPVVWPGRREKDYELIENCLIVGGRRTSCLQIQGRGLWRKGLSKWVGAIREDQSHWCNMR